MDIKNLFIFFIPLLLFSYWMTIGYATLCLLRTQRHTLQNLLLAPAVGIAINLLPIFWLNHLGFGTNDFALILSAVIFIISISILFYFRPIYHFRYLFFATTFICALFLTGHPLLKFGFNWLSYGNDDMVNYCLRAMRYLQSGFTTLPDESALTSGRDYTLSYWFWDALTGLRAGGELLLAWISTLTGLNPLQMFMPLIITFLLCLISGTGALLYQSKNEYAISLATCVLLTCSGLTTFAVLYQFLGQLIGMILFLGVCVVTLQTFSTHQKHTIIRQSLLIGLLMSAFLISYPELLPFLGLTILVYFIVLFCSGWRPTSVFGLIAIGSLLFLLAFLNIHLLSVFFFLKIQILRGLNDILNNFFPYFLSANGFAYLWGLEVIPKSATSFMILIGISLTIFTLVANLKQLKLRTPVTVIIYVLIFLSLSLCINHTGFGLFKIAMYSQPFLLGAFTIGLFYYIKSDRWRMVFISLLAFIFFLGQYQYIHFSLGNLGQPFVEIATASESHLITELNNLNHQLKKSQPIIIETPNIIIAKLLALYLTNREIHFYSKDFFYNKVITIKILYDKDLKRTLNVQFQSLADSITEKLQKSLTLSHFFLKNILPPQDRLSFYHSNQCLKDNSLFIISSPLRSIFNRNKFDKTVTHNFMILSWAKAINYLIFIDSNYGKEYYVSDFTPISLYNLEPDYFDSKHSVAGIGRYLLFRVTNPTPSLRMVLEITKSFGENNSTTLPKATLIGTTNEVFPITGSGSARVYSPPIMPQMIDHIPYLLLDMGVYNKPPVNNQHDTRQIYAYSRNISLISDADYQNLPLPTHLTHFPHDLLKGQFEYAGIYEDGFISNDAYLYMHQPLGPTQFIINGLIHKTSNNQPESLLTVLINGKTIKKIAITPGEFFIQIPIRESHAKNRIDLHFSNTYRLPHHDHRQVAALIHYIGFDSENDHLQLKLPSSISHFPDDLLNSQLKYYNIYGDGWVPKQATVYLTQPHSKSYLLINGLVPLIGNKHYQTTLTVLIDNISIAKKILRPGQFSISLPMTNYKNHRKVELLFSETQVLSNNDNRKTGALISYIGFKKG